MIADATVADTVAQAPAVVLIDKTTFAEMFIGGFKLANGVTGLRSLDIPPEREPSAVECANACHDIIAETPSLHWMLSPHGKWWPRIIAIGAFTLPMARGVAAEMRERRTPPVKANFSAAKRATQSQPVDPNEPSAEDLAALNQR